MTAGEIKKLLRKRYSDPRQWIYFEECPVGTGWRSSRLMDAYVLGCWPSASQRLAFEIKVSRQDFLSELKNPAKRRAALYFSNQFFFVAPKGLIKVDELPVECGLMEVDQDRIVTKIDAPYRDSIRPTWNFTVALMRRMASYPDTTNAELLCQLKLEVSK